MSLIPQLMSGRSLEHDGVTEKQWVDRGAETYVTLFSDFIQDIGETMNLPFVAAEAGTTGATIAFIDAADGVFRLAHNGTNETQAVGITLGGTNAIAAKDSAGNSNEVILEVRAKITFATDTFFEAASVYEVIIGLATADTAISVSAATFDGAADNVGFRLGGGAQATNSIFLESDDGATSNDNDDVDSGIDFTDATYHVYRIDMTDLSNVQFYVDNVLANNGNTFSISDIAAADLLEPYILFARTSNGGTERAHSMDIDYIKCTWKRS